MEGSLSNKYGLLWQRSELDAIREDVFIYLMGFLLCVGANMLIWIKKSLYLRISLLLLLQRFDIMACMLFINDKRSLYALSVIRLAIFSYLRVMVNLGTRSR